MLLPFIVWHADQRVLDWYIEISNTCLYGGFGYGGDDAITARRFLVYIINTYMPYVTEQLWYHLPGAPNAEGKAENASILADWPQMDGIAPFMEGADAIATFEYF